MSDILKKAGSVTQNTGDATAAEAAQAKLDADAKAAADAADLESKRLADEAKKQVEADAKKVAADALLESAKSTKLASSAADVTKQETVTSTDATFLASLNDIGFDEPLRNESNLGEFEEEIESAEVREPIDCFRHRNIKRFKVGEFEFTNNLLFVYTDDERDRFLNLHRTLEPIDKNNIVRFNYKAVQNLESSINERTLVRRGALSTGRTKDPKVISN